MGNKKLEIFDLREKGYNLQDNIFAAFSNYTLVFPDGDNKIDFNSPLSEPIQKWTEKIIPNMQPKVFLTTYFAVCKKSANTDIENLLLYNLNEKKNMNKILESNSESNSLKKIIIQGMDEIFPYWPQSTVKTDLYCHYYFYGVFNIEEYTKYILYDDRNCKTNFFLGNSDYKELFKANNRNDKEQILNQISQKYNFPNHFIVPLNSKFCLKININSNLFPKTVDDLKKLIDIIVVFCNKICIIETDKPRVNKNRYNPTDDLLYYCEIKNDIYNKETKNDIIFYVCPICDKNKDNCCCEEKQDNVKSFPGFREEDKNRVF